MSTRYDSDNHDAAADLAALRRRHDGGLCFRDGLRLTDNPYDGQSADFMRWQRQWEVVAMAARRDLATQGEYARERAETTAVIERAGLLLERVQNQWTKPPPSLAMELRAVREAVNRALTRLTAPPALAGRSAASGSSLPAPAQAPTLGAPERPPNAASGLGPERPPNKSPAA